ncbi:hypothetical protein [Alienimonas sp. DA493]|uniref:hypothetical protein n=1 Tax=Alienimonas sp. DA493 TaxID=3373605 RepID=UPI00375417C0
MTVPVLPPEEPRRWRWVENRLREMAHAIRVIGARIPPGYGDGNGTWDPTGEGFGLGGGTLVRRATANAEVAAGATGTFTFAVGGGTQTAINRHPSVAVQSGATCYIGLIDGTWDVLIPLQGCP